MNTLKYADQGLLLMSLPCDSVQNDTQTFYFITYSPGVTIVIDMKRNGDFMPKGRSVLSPS